MSKISGDINREIMGYAKEHTGDAIKTKAPSKQYRDNYEAIFSEDKQAKQIPTETMKVQEDERTKI